MSKLFESHGRIKVYTLGQVFVSEVEGPWNVELTHHWIRSLGPHIMELGRRGPMAGMCLFTRSMLCTPEALELSARATRETAKIVNIVAMAHVAAPDVEGRELMQRHFETFVRDLYPLVIFEDFGIARNWVEGVLAQAQDEERD